MIIAKNNSDNPKYLLLDSSEQLFTNPLGAVTMIKKTYDWGGAVTAQDVWDPTSGTKFVITDILIGVNTATDITLFDSTDSTANRIFKGYFADNSNLVSNQKLPIVSSTADNILKITTGGGSGSLTIYGYEI